MPPVSDLIPLVLLPAAIVLAIRGLAALALKGRPTARDAVVAVAVAVAFVVVLWGRDVRPHLPLAGNESAWEWAFWLAPAAAIVGVAEAALAPPVVARVALRLAVGAAVAWLLVARIPPERTDVDSLGKAARVIAGALAVFETWCALAPASVERQPAVAGSAVVGIGAGGAVFGLVATTIGMSEALGCLAVAIGAAAAPIPLRSGARIPPPAAAVAAVVLVAVLLYAQAFQIYSDIPLATLLLLLAAPSAGLLVPKGRGPLVTALLGAAAALVLVLAAAAAGGVFASKPAAGY